MTYVDEEPDEESGADRMAQNRDELREAVIGHRIVSATRGRTNGLFGSGALTLTLDNGRRVDLIDTDDCCAYTELGDFLLHPDMVDHIITGVGTTDGFESWHVFADAGDVLKLGVCWSPGNLGYYGYGFDIRVTDPVSRET